VKLPAHGDKTIAIKTEISAPPVRDFAMAVALPPRWVSRIARES
jgi:hypothetical protein